MNGETLVAIWFVGCRVLLEVLAISTWFRLAWFMRLRSFVIQFADTRPGRLGAPEAREALILG